MPTAKIDSLDHEGRGVTRVEGKAVFVEGALPGERVEYVVRRAKPSYEQGEVVRVLRPSAQRPARQRRPASLKSPSRDATPICSLGATLRRKTPAR